MLPALKPGSIVVAVKRPGRIVPGAVVVFVHDGMEKIKRVQAIEDGRVYVVGDNLALSTDSRDFGWLDRSAIVARVCWPRVRTRQ